MAVERQLRAALYEKLELYADNEKVCYPRSGTRGCVLSAPCSSKPRFPQAEALQVCVWQWDAGKGRVGCGGAYQAPQFKSEHLRYP